MQYDLAATIHFGPCSRFNEFLLSCMCVSLGLALSFDPHHHQCISKRHRLALQNEDVEPLQERYLALYYVFDFFLSKKSEEICPVNGTYWVCLFVCFFFTLNDNSNRIVTGRFPTILPGKLECSWIFEFLSFIKFGHLSWQFGIVACKKRACVHICSFQQFRPILLIYWRLDSVWWDPLDWTFLIIWITWIMFFSFVLFLNFGLTSLACNNSSSAPGCSFLGLNVRFHGIVQIRWFVNMWSDYLSVCSTERYLSPPLPCSVSFLFPPGASQIVSPRQQLYVPQREPKYPGNQASFSLLEPFSFPDTLYCLLFLPSLLSPSSLPLVSANIQSHSFLSWFHPGWSHSFFLQPPHLPSHLIDQVLIFVCLIEQWYITEYEEGYSNWLLS